MLIVALTGPKGAGKDTVADVLVNHYMIQQRRVKRLAFADPIKKVIQHIFDLDPSSNKQYDDFKRTTLHFNTPNSITRDQRLSQVSARHVVREIGMLMRSYDEKQFNAYVEDHFKGASDQDVFIVTDLRFDNEYVLLRKWGAKIVRIERPGYEYDGHITERGFDDKLVDFTISNIGSLQELTHSIYNLINNIEKETT